MFIAMEREPDSMNSLHSSVVEVLPPDPEVPGSNPSNDKAVVKIYIFIWIGLSWNLENSD